MSLQPRSKPPVSLGKLLRVFVALFVLGSLPTFVRAGDDPFTRATLKGINAISVIVEGLSDDAKAIGLSEQEIQIDTELKLRLAGIRVIPEEERSRTPGRPMLYINVGVLGRATQITVELMQDATLERNGERALGATTWSTAILLENAGVQAIRDHNKDLVDAFVNAWLSVNPRN